MPDVHTQTLLTGNRIEDFAKENRRLKHANNQRKYDMVKRMVKREVKDTLHKQKKSPCAPKRARSA